MCSLPGVVSVGDDLASGHRRAPEEVHVEAREGRTSTSSGEWVPVEVGEGCEILVKAPPVAEWVTKVLVPGVTLRERLGVDTIT